MSVASLRGFLSANELKRLEGAFDSLAVGQAPKQPAALNFAAALEQHAQAGELTLEAPGPRDYEAVAASPDPTKLHYTFATAGDLNRINESSTFASAADLSKVEALFDRLKG